MTFSKKYRSVLLLSLFFVSLIFQIAYTFNVLSGKQFINKDHTTNLLPKKNTTDDNLLTNFIEEETEDGDDDEVISINPDLLLSFLHFEFLFEKINQTIAFHTSQRNFISIFIEISNLRI
jgi:hypothetical protein